MIVTWTLPESEINIETGDALNKENGDIPVVQTVQKNIITVKDNSRIEQIIEELKDLRTFVNCHGKTMPNILEYIEKCRQGKTHITITDAQLQIRNYEHDEMLLTQEAWELLERFSTLSLKNPRIELLYKIKQMCGTENCDIIFNFKDFCDINGFNLEQIETLCKILIHTQGMTEEKKKYLQKVAPNFATFALDVINCIDINPTEVISYEEYRKEHFSVNSSHLERNGKCLLLARQINQALKK